MLKYKLDSLEGIEEGQQGLYRQEGDAFVLEIDGLDPEKGADISGLKSKVEELLSEKKASETKAKEAEAAQKAAQAAVEDERARKAGDIESLESSWQKRFDEQQAMIDGQAAKTAEGAVRSTAMGIAAKLAEGANQQNLEVFIRERLRFEDDQVKVTDESGNLTISTLDQLTEEFRANDRFASMVTGSKANGGGAATQLSNNGGADKTATRSSFEAMSHPERAAFAKDGGKVIND